MSSIRKAFWPAAIAIGFLVFLGALGSGNALRTASADDDAEICEIEGPKIIQEGKTYLYIAWLESDTDGEFTVTVDNISGQSQITSFVEEVEKKDKHKDKKDNNGEHDDDLSYEEIKGANMIQEVASFDVLDVSDDLLEDLQAVQKDFKFKIDACLEDGRTTLNSIRRILNDLKLIGTDVITGDIDGDELLAAAQSILDDLNAGETDCQDIGQNAAKAAIGAGATAGESQDLEKAVTEVCEQDFVLDEELCLRLVTQMGGSQPSGPSTTPDPTEKHECGKQEDEFLDSAVVVDVTCLKAGQFDLTFSDEDETEIASTLKILCQGAPDDATITASPTQVEIIPAMGNVSHSLITVDLLADGDQAGPGSEVDFTVNRCSIETSGVDTKAEYEAARTIFSANNAAVPASAANIEASAAAVATVDGTRQADTTVSFVATYGGDDHTVAAAILGCSPIDTGATVAVPGVATVTAIIAVEDGQDIVRTVTVTVIGPPATLTVAAAPSTLRCGEKATVTATVKDSIGQNVSEHTRVEAVTNAGGVLGGTGAVAGLAGPVVPISSTVSETFNGVSTFFLLTSEQHSGPYEVVVTTGGAGAVTQSLGGVFSTPPLSAQATVACSIPTVAAPAAPAPAVTAPRTGTGITPPNTGDAGLVGTTDSSWALFAAVGAVAFAVAGLASLKFARKS